MTPASSQIVAVFRHMKPYLRPLILLLLFAPAISAQAQSAVAGQWEGSINLPGTALGIAVTLTQTGNAWTGTIDIPAQGAKGLALGNIVVSGESISFGLPGVPGQPELKGTIAADGKSVTGNFSQNGASFPFKLQRPAPVEIVNGEKLIGIWE